jgi:hypothetical protein
MFTEAALVVVQLRSDVDPLGMLVGSALKEIVGAGFAETVIVVDEEAVPPGPVAVAV